MANNDAFQWFHAMWQEYDPMENAWRTFGTDVLSPTWGNASRVVIEDVITHGSVYINLTIRYMGTWTEYQKLHGADGELLMPGEPLNP